MFKYYVLDEFFFRSCGIPGFEDQPDIYVWLQVCDVVVRLCSRPFRLSYQTTDTYAQHGQDLLHRLVMENCLSHFSGITWSRVDIFKKPTQAELRRGLVRRVDALNPAETGFFNINLVDITSMTLGSFQPRQVDKYITMLRRKEVDNGIFVDLATQDQDMQQLPTIEGYIWDEVHGPNGPPGWDPQLFGPWENVRIILLFIPAHMKADKMRSVVLMYKPVGVNLIYNNMGFRSPQMARLKYWCCGPSDRSDSCAPGERLAGACCHCSSALYISGVLSHNPNAYSSKYRRCHLFDRAINQAANEEIVRQVLS